MSHAVGELLPTAKQSLSSDFRTVIVVIFWLIRQSLMTKYCYSCFQMRRE